MFDPNLGAAGIANDIFESDCQFLAARFAQALMGMRPVAGAVKENEAEYERNTSHCKQSNSAVRDSKRVRPYSVIGFRVSRVQFRVSSSWVSTDQAALAGEAD